MIDVTGKPVTLRSATASGILCTSPETRERAERGDLPKGNLLDIARAAALLASKKTPELIPHCHPVTIDHLDIRFDFVRGDDALLPGRHGIRVTVMVKSIARTGPEMEALTAVSTALLVMYDLLKPIDKGLSIEGVRLTEKTGGKTDPRSRVKEGTEARILFVSDAQKSERKEDHAGHTAKTMLEKAGVKVTHLEEAGFDPGRIESLLKSWIEEHVPYIFVLGGTGLSERERTIDVVEKLIDREIPGVGEAMRRHGTDRTPIAMFSRSLGGVAGSSVILALPGSTRGAQESLQAVLPGLFHAQRMMAKRGPGGEFAHD